jgi:hypothetical protein
MRRVAKNALILAGLVGAAIAVRGYLGRESAASGGEIQLSYDDGSMNSPTPPESEEIAQIARKLLEIGV